MTTRRALLLANPAARGTTDVLGDALARLRTLGVEVAGAPFDDPARFGDALRAAAPAADLAIVAGGDGTLHHALGDLLAAGLPLGILPFGTANNVARTLGLPQDPVDAVEAIGRGAMRRIDVGRVNGRPFLTTASLGLSVAITEALDPGVKRRFGALAYALASARVLRRARPFHATIRWEGGHLRSRTVQVVVGNGRYYGGALPVAEDATIDDHALDLYSLEVRHWWQLLGVAPQLRRGVHGKRDDVAALRARWIEVETDHPMPIDADGELVAETPARFEVEHRALAVFMAPFTPAETAVP
jgi:YegS/Rv2252/BmrU family lipid kinase